MSDFYYEFIAGCFGGFAQVYIGQPFDIVKVRLQSAPPESKVSAVQILKDIIRKEGGIRALWKGSMPPLVGVGAAVSIQFGVNENVKKLVQRFMGGDHQFTFAQLFGCGVVAGLANAAVSVPSEHIRILMQTQSTTNPVYKGPLDCVKQIYGKYGLRGLYRATPATLAREAVSFGTYFSVYGWAMEKLAQGESRDQMGMGKIALAGAISGVILWPLCFPFDVIKTKLQTDSFTEPKFKNARDCARQLYNTFGLKGFFRGIAPCVLRAGPVNAGTFVVYELAYRAITPHHQNTQLSV